MHEYLISVGSNIEPDLNIEKARDILAAECRLLGTSTVIETAPVGYQNQANFLNAAFMVESELDLDEFRAYLKRVELRLGREHGPIKSGPRTIDLDIIAYDREVVDASYTLQEYVRRPVDEILANFDIQL